MGWDNASAITYAVRGEVPDLTAWIGRTVRTNAPYEVNAAQIGYYCSLVEDSNPNYWFEDRAANGPYGGLVAPPGMVMVWMFPLPWHPRGRPENGPLLGLEIPLPADTLINVSTDTSFSAPMRLGDRLAAVDRVVDISAEKRTALGRGWFVTTESEVSNQRGERVAVNRNVIFRYVAGEHPGSTVAPSPAGDPGHHGEPLPEVSMEVTASVAALNAAATRDFFPGHHDVEYARAQGVASTYLNTMFFHGFADRLALEWAGPDAWIVRRTLRMKAPACAGRTLTAKPHLAPGEGPVRDVLIDMWSGEVSAAESRVTVDTRGWRGPAG